MKKLLLTAAISAAVFAGQAHAVPLNANGSPNTTALGTTSELWISGSSAATPFVEKSIIADCTGTVYKYANGTADFTWICDSSLAAGTVNVVHKRDGGGSVTGVQSAMNVDTVAIPLPTYATTASLNTATCAAPVSGISACTATAIVNAKHAGDINLADVDSAQFEALANGNVKGASTLINSSVVSQIFGVVVNLRLRNAMQVASIQAGSISPTCATLVVDAGGVVTSATGFSEAESCMPSLTTEQVSAIFGSNRLTDWYNIAFGGAIDPTTGFVTGLQSLVGVQPTADQPSNTNIHYCSRTAGSGTLATMNIKFENQCFKGNEAITTSATPLLGAETDPLAGNQKVVHAMSGSGDLENCLVGLNDGVATGTTFTPYPPMTNGSGFRWAIGIMGAERNAAGTLAGTPAKKYRFVKIDGYAPSAKNVVDGKYKFWAEMVKVTKTGQAAPNALGLDILANLGNANQITALNVTHNFGVSGFLGTATNPLFLPSYDAPIAPGTLGNGAFDVARPVNNYTHATSAGTSLNHCRAPSIPAGAKAVQAFTLN